VLVAAMMALHGRGDLGRIGRRRSLGQRNVSAPERRNRAGTGCGGISLHGYLEVQGDGSGGLALNGR
jgi:hypothetical protein